MIPCFTRGLQRTAEVSSFDALIFKKSGLIGKPQFTANGKNIILFQIRDESTRACFIFHEIFCRLEILKKPVKKLGTRFLS